MKLIKYVQEDCVPCKKLTTMLGFMGVEVDETISLDEDDAKEKAKILNIMSTPTMMFVDEFGEEIARISGDNVGQVQSFLQEYGRL